MAELKDNGGSLLKHTAEFKWPLGRDIANIRGDDNRSDISRSQIDLYFVWQLAKGKNWFILDPQIILDHENSKEAATIEAEWGFMIAPQQGISAYVRPGADLGADRPYDWNFEFAVKFVWR